MRIALSTQSIITRRYLIEPGDGTRYNFMIHWFHVPAEHIPDCKSIVDADYQVETYIETDVHPERVIPGVKNMVKEYVGVTICLPYDVGDLLVEIGENQTGSYEFMLAQLREHSGDTLVNYAAAHMRCHPDVVATVLAACSVLAFEPDNLEGAIMAMRKAAKSREQSQE